MRKNHWNLFRHLLWAISFGVQDISAEVLVKQLPRLLNII